MGNEKDRLRFIEERDGQNAALVFARRTYAIYRECLGFDGKNNRKFHHASIAAYRKSFIESCLVFRKYLRDAPVAEWIRHGTSTSDYVGSTPTGRAK